MNPGYDEQWQGGVVHGFVKVLQELRKRYHDYKALSEAIRGSDDTTQPTIDRRKLARIADDESVPGQVLSTHLTLAELAILDRFFLREGYGGLAPALTGDSVLRSAVRSGRVVFLIGAKTINRAGRDPI